MNGSKIAREGEGGVDASAGSGRGSETRAKWGGGGGVVREGALGEGRNF